LPELPSLQPVVRLIVPEGKRLGALAMNNHATSMRMPRVLLGKDKLG
jgi:hypothetical protein